MLQAFSTPRNARISLAFLTAAVVSMAAAVPLGVDDSLPGALLGVIAVLAAILAFAHPWRDEGPFRFLLWGSLAAVVPCGILAGFFESLQDTMSAGPAWQVIVHVLNVVFFGLAMFIFPPAMLVGLVGSLAVARRARKNRRGQANFDA